MAVLTKTEQILNILAESIHKGKWKAGERLPAERDLMVELGVSRTTLRHAMAALSSQNLIVARPGSGVYVAESAVPATIGILAKSAQLASPLGYWYHSVIEAFQKKISDDGRRTMLFVASGDSPKDMLRSTGICSNSILKDLAGVISLHEIGPFKDVLDGNGTRHVTISGVAPECGSMVRQDFVSLCGMAREMFLSKGYNDYLVMIMDNGAMPRESSDYWYKVVSDSVGGDSSQVISVPFTLDYRHVYDTFKDIWKSGNRPRAIFFPDDGIFDVASRAIVELNIKVPDELAVITQASTVRRFNFPVEVTRIGWDPDQIAGIAWDLLGRLVSNKDEADEYICVPPVIIGGNSV